MYLFVHDLPYDEAKPHHAKLKMATYIGEGTIQEHHNIKGEVYRLTLSILQALDEMGIFPHLFAREQLIVSLEDGSHLFAMHYIKRGGGE